MRRLIGGVLLALLPLAACQFSSESDRGDQSSTAMSAGEFIPPEESGGDNSRCHVCHMNFEEEELAVTHSEADIGCEHCHGDSSAHCGDENNTTPPDILIAMDQIVPSCQECHEDTDVSHAEAEVDDYEDEVCTQCHGEHAMAQRTIRWNKKTGELIEG